MHKIVYSVGLHDLCAFSFVYEELKSRDVHFNFSMWARHKQVLQNNLLYVYYLSKILGIIYLIHKIIDYNLYDTCQKIAV